MTPVTMNGRSNGSRADWQTIEDDRPLTQLLSDLTAHVQQLVRGEVDLVKQEAVDNAKKTGIYIGLGVGAALFAAAALLFLGHLVAQSLNTRMDEWAAYGIVTLLYLGGAAVLGWAAKEGLSKQQVAPTDSIDQAKEDLTWIKQHR
jgi:hypothetical protein